MKPQINIQDSPQTAAEPSPAYTMQDIYAVPRTNRVNTMTVDDYFDQLIELVKKDYETLRS